jgi:hypothetical protein
MKKTPQKRGRPVTTGRVYVTRSISFDPQLKERAEVRAKELGFRSFSEYLSRLIERDVAQGGPLFIEPRRKA